MGEFFPVHTRAARASLWIRSGQTFAKAPALNAPEEEPKNEYEEFPDLSSMRGIAAFKSSTPSAIKENPSVRLERP